MNVTISLSFLIFNTIVFSLCALDIPKLRDAVIIKPIVDASISMPIPINDPASPQNEKIRRAHQFLFNQRVSVIGQDQGCLVVQVTDDNAIYGTRQEGLHNTFWIKRSDIKMLNEIAKDIRKTIPKSIYGKGSTIVLTYPWKGLSTGTRLRYCPEYTTDQSYLVAYPDHQKNSISYDYVSHQDAIVETPKTSLESRALFVRLINGLMDRLYESGDKVIPYVWGGSSFIRAHAPNDYYLAEDGSAWHRAGNQMPYTGYDCSEFVMRMAQMVGINFPWKITTTMKDALSPLAPEDQLQEGDLIWTHGHIMLVSNLERNEVIESRGYSSGYGCVHRIRLCECLDGVETFNELCKRYVAQEPIRYKNKAGFLADKSQPFQLLKLPCD